MTYNDLKAAVKELNEAGIEGFEKLKVVGVKKEVQLEQFLQRIEEIDDAGKVEEVPPTVIDAYNWFSKEGNEMEAAPAKKAAPKKSVKKSRYGHNVGAKSADLDDMLFEGATVAQMMEKLDLKRVRVIGHIKHLKNDKGVTFKEEKPEDGKLNDTYYKANEEAV